MPQITVIVPVYKVEPYLHRCVDSILAQTFTDFELILVDDGSPDNCGAICDEYAAQDSRVRVIHKPNGGLSAARNAGIDWAFANSDSEWLSFIDSDDWVHPMYLEALYQGVADTGLSVIIGGFQRTTGEEPAVDTNALRASVRNTEEFFCAENVNAIVAWGKLYKKEDFSDIRYPAGIIREDEFVTYQILFKYEDVAVISEPLYAYYQNPNGIMGVKWTPARASIIDALQQRTDFFSRKGFDGLYQTSVRQLLWSISGQITSTQEFGSKYESEARSYKKRFRACLRRYSKDLSLREMKNAYVFLYPKLGLIFAFRRDVIQNGLLSALKKTAEHIRRRK